MYKVKGKDSLMKDPSSGGVLNVDDAAYRAAKLAKKRVLDAKKKEQELEERILRLESALELLLKDKD